MLYSEWWGKKIQWIEQNQQSLTTPSQTFIYRIHGLNAVSTNLFFTGSTLTKRLRDKAYRKKTKHIIQVKLSIDSLRTVYKVFILTVLLLVSSSKVSSMVCMCSQGVPIYQLLPFGQNGVDWVKRNDTLGNISLCPLKPLKLTIDEKLQF